MPVPLGSCLTMTEKRKLIGEILVEEQILTVKTVERILAKSLKANRKLGTVLEEMGLITPDELTTALAKQFGLKVVRNLCNIQIPAAVLKLVAADVAVQHLLLPLKVENGWLALAFADPTTTRVIQNLAANIELKIAPHLASRQELTAAIAKNYFGTSSSNDTRRTLLVVEDDKLISAKLNEILSGKGYRVVTAGDGMEAYKLLLTEKPQVVLTDKEMPKMNGYGLLAAMKNMPEMKRIPVILLTGRMTDEEESGAFDKGFFDYILKPVKDSTLVTRVKRAIHFYDTQT